MPGRVHLVGIAGAGMRALAEILLAAGWRVSGSDLDLSSVHWLRQRGAQIHEGHAAANVPRDSTLVVYSDAVDAENIERRAAAGREIPQFSYAAAIAKLGQGRRTIAVAGTHGKSTTTAMLAHVLRGDGRDPTVLFGATPIGEHSGGHLGRDAELVVEACEYRRNFLQLEPATALLLNAEWDHPDTYRSAEDVRAALGEFAARVPSDGHLIVPCEDTLDAAITASGGQRFSTWGMSPAADWWAAEVERLHGTYRFGLMGAGRLQGYVLLKVPGPHNVHNAVAAAAAAAAEGVDGATICESLSTFPGLERRLEVVGALSGVTYVDDYAHHPTEIRAAATAVREMFPARRLWCVFEPHQSARLRALLDDFAASLHNAHGVLVTDVFAARESEGDQSAGTALVEQLTDAGGQALRISGQQNAVVALERMTTPGDVVLTLGAGVVRRIVDELAERTGRYRQAG